MIPTANCNVYIGTVVVCESEVSTSAIVSSKLDVNYNLIMLELQNFHIVVIVLHRTLRTMPWGT